MSGTAGGRNGDEACAQTSRNGNEKRIARRNRRENRNIRDPLSRKRGRGAFVAHATAQLYWQVKPANKLEGDTRTELYDAGIALTDNLAKIHVVNLTDHAP